MINSSTYRMFTYLFFKQIQKYILLKKCSNVSRARFNLGDGEGLKVPCTLKITGERKFVSILTEKFNVLKEKQIFFFIFPQKFELLGGILVKGTIKMVRLSECSSYRGFELSSDFYEKVLAKVQGELQNSSSYWKFELSGVRVIGSILYSEIPPQIPGSHRVVV